MAKNIKQARPVEPCRKCNKACFGRDWEELDGLCVTCWKKRERDYEFLLDERHDEKIMEQKINEDDSRIDR